MRHILIFGPGYTAGRFGRRLAAQGWQVASVGRRAGDGAIALDDPAAVRAAIAGASHILSSIPPREASDPVLDAHAALLAAAPARWIGYLSSTGVYGDSRGAWVDEATPLAGRRGGRLAADLAWRELHPQVRVFRLPGIYGPGRSALDRVAEGRAHRIALPDQVFSRIHVDDIVGGLLASLDRGPPGVYNLADDLPAHQNRVIEEASALLGLSPPPLQSIDQAGLSPMARAFYAENRRVANGKAKRLLGWRPLYPTYRAGLRALVQSAESAPASAATSASG